VIFAELNEQNDPARSGRLAMTIKCSLIAATVVSLLAGSGCETCASRGFGRAYEAGPNCEVPTCQRNEVYVYAVSGMNPADAWDVDKLREELNKQGFAKVSCGQSLLAYTFASDMRHIHAEHPDAVFVILGSASAAPTATRLAQKAVLDGLPVAAFVMLDHDGKATIPNLGVRTLAIGGYGTSTPISGEAVVVATSSRYNLASDMRTVETIARLLNDVAWAIPQTVELETEWSYPHTPPARPMLDPGPYVDWLYLFDQPGGMTQAIDETLSVIPVAATKPATPAPVPTYTSVQK
jgi:hypothetical protein